MMMKTDGCSDWEVAKARNSVRLMFWTIGWVLTLALAAFGPKLIWNFQTALTILAVLVNLGAGAGMIMANGRHLRGLDELHRKIFLDTCALTLGAGLVSGLSYELLEDVRLISFQPEIPHLVILMCLTFLVGLIAGHRKYR
ncbi:MAG: hypothetical protein MUO51_11790 [Woeseiaceae bacterium]|nr:hypothetical protein [Woeseiaceae bacterium]